MSSAKWCSFLSRIQYVETHNALQEDDADKTNDRFLEWSIRFTLEYVTNHNKKWTTNLFVKRLYVQLGQ